MRTAIKKGLAKSIMCQLENSPSTDDLAMQVEVYAELFELAGLTDPEKISRRFNLWCFGQKRFPTPADLINMRISDYAPVDRAGPALGNDSRRLPLRSKTVSAGEYASEWLAKMREAVQ